MLSPEAQTLMSSIDFTIPVNPDATPAKGSIPLSEIDLIDFDLMADEDKKAILEENFLDPEDFRYMFTDDSILDDIRLSYYQDGEWITRNYNESVTLDEIKNIVIELIGSGRI